MQQQPKTPQRQPDERRAREGEAAPAPVDLSEESVAGEEDPGAALDVDARVPAPRPAPAPKDETRS